MRYFLAFSCMFFLWACGNDIREIKKVTRSTNVKVETATDVVILYSDSAVVKVRITSPTLKRYTELKETYDEFPDGLIVEFLDEKQRVKSWLEADFAIRKDNDKKIYIEKNVVLYNKRDDKLMTEELIWDEAAEEIYTNKFVKITQPSVGDTSFGNGFKADQEFTRFEIKGSFSGIKNAGNLLEDIK